MNRMAHAIFAAVIVASALILAATAEARPLVTLTLPTQVDAGRSAVFQWSASRVPSHARVELQAQIGTGRVWKRLIRLPGSRGKDTLPPHALGRYPLRIAVVSGHNHLLASRNARLDVFGEVPLETLLGNGAQTYSTANFSFTYVGRAQADTYNQEGTAWTISAARNHCRSVKLQFPVGDANGTTTETLAGVVSLVQQSAVPVSVSVSSVPPAVYSLETALVPGQSWSVKLKITSTDDDGLILYAPFNGVAICDSTETAI
jgi:hypothetical protein